jgi:hypothetical protein
MGAHPSMCCQMASKGTPMSQKTPKANPDLSDLEALCLGLGLYAVAA